MALGFGPRRSFVAPPTIQWLGSGQRVWRAYYNSGSGNIEIDLCSSQGHVKDSTTTVDNATSGRNDVMLNEPLCLDPVTGRLHILYAANVDNSSQPARLYHKSSTDNGSTFSSAHQLDDGSTHGNNRFYRVGIAAYNDYVTAVYSSTSNSVFTSDGLWETHSSDGGATWSAFAKLYTSPVMAGEPNIALGPDGAVHVSWYDPGVVANQGGDVYYAKGTFNGSGWTWQTTPSRLTNGEVWGRCRVFTSNGVVMIVGNTNWGGSVADAGLLRSTDNGATWGSTQTIASHTMGNGRELDHPWGSIDSDRAAIVWAQAGTPITYYVITSLDAGASWSSTIVPMTTNANSDAPRLVITDDLLIMGGVDNAGNVLWAEMPFWAPDPAVSSVIDAFNRTENPCSDGGKWTQSLDGSGSLKTNGATASRQGPSGTFNRSGNYRNDFTVNSSYEVYFDLVSGFASDGVVDLSLWTTARTGYNFSLDSTGLHLNHFISAAYQSTPVDDAVDPIKNGDKYLLRLDANGVSGLRYDATNSVWREVVRWSNNAYRSSLVAHIDIAATTDLPLIDNFSGGVLNAPSNTVAPAISGTVGDGQTLTVSTGTWATAAGATPTRYSYQWQQSLDGGSNWTNITRATLKFYTIGTAAGQYRVQVTGKNSVGTFTATSNVMAANILPAGFFDPLLRPTAWFDPLVAK